MGNNITVAPMNCLIFVLVNETTADIHCVVCKEDNTAPGNEIVLCDSCSVGEFAILFFYSHIHLVEIFLILCLCHLIPRYRTKIEESNQANTGYEKRTSKMRSYGVNVRVFQPLAYTE